MNELKIGIIGCGHISGTHIKCLKTIGDNRIVAVADVNKANAEQRAAEIGGSPSVYDQPLELIEKEELDALFICVPPFAHGEIEKAALAKNLPMMIEKPVGPNFAATKELAELIPDSLPVSIAYNWRYIPNLERIREMISEKQPILYNAEWKEQMADADWWHKRAMSGGALVDQASHLLDMGIYLCGPVKKVLSVVTRRDCPQPGGDIPDMILATWEFANGTHGRILHTCALNQLKHRIGFDVMFPKVEAKLERVGDLEIISEGDLETSPGNYNKWLCNIDSYVDEDRIFLDAVRSGDNSKIRCTFKDAANTVAFADAIYKCAELQQPVEPERIW